MNKPAKRVYLALVACLAATGCGSDSESDDTDTDADDVAPDGTPVACSTQMFDKYGLDAFVAVNNSIIDLAVAAPTASVGTSFQDLAAEGGPRVEAFRTNLANFLVMVYGGPNNYEGPNMVDAHAGLDITSAQYDFFVTSVIVPALADNGVPQADIEDCFAPPVVDPEFKASIVTM